MKAYDISMVMICLCAGIYIVDLIGFFGSVSGSDIFPLLMIFNNPIITISGVSIRGVDLIAGAIASATIVILNSNAINDRGVAVIVYSAMFWGSWGISSNVILKIGVPGISMFWGVLSIIAVFIFIISLVQIPTGGMRSHV